MARATKRKDRSAPRPPFVIAGESIAPGSRRRLDLPVARLPTRSDLTMPVHVIHGQARGPTLFVSAAVHGDELNGVEIIRRVLGLRLLDRLAGTLIAVPVVNVFGLIGQSRYLPDRRDLNRSFPGSGGGSLAARIADLFMKEIVARSTHGIDLHTGAVHRTNLPQVRATLDRPGCRRIARAFGAPVIIDAPVRQGSLRAAVTEAGVPNLLFEGGEALRFDEGAIRAGVRGVVGVMRTLKMVSAPSPRVAPAKPLVARSSRWVRAPVGGIHRIRTRLGVLVDADVVLGMVSGPLGGGEEPVRAARRGLVIGLNRLPIVNEGDALFHVADVGRRVAAERVRAAFQQDPNQGPVYFDPEEGPVCADEDDG